MSRGAAQIKVKALFGDEVGVGFSNRFSRMSQLHNFSRGTLRDILGRRTRQSGLGDSFAKATTAFGVALSCAEKWVRSGILLHCDMGLWHMRIGGFVSVNAIRHS
jgi:hypothetical protein